MYDVELFVLKNSVITKSLRSILSRQSITEHRGELEVQADSLVSDYMKQVNFAIISASERMSEFYKLFYALENDMRDLIESAMLDAKGVEWWNLSVPQSVQENARKNFDREAAEGLPPRSDRLIHYTTFGELGEIIKENWDVF